MAKDSPNPAKNRLAGIGLDVLALAGLASIVYGAWLIYIPAAYLLAGAAAVGTALQLARRS